MTAPIIPPIPINALVAYDSMPIGGVFLVSLPHPDIPNERLFGAVDVTAFAGVRIAAPVSDAPVTTGI